MSRAKLNKLKKKKYPWNHTEYVSDNEIKLEINNKKITENSPNRNGRVLSYPWLNEEAWREIKHI